MTKNNKKVIGLIFLTMLGGLILFFFKPKCLFKELINIRCPACGMTRALKLIVEGKPFESFDYNFLALPLVLFGIFILCVMIVDIICKKNRLSKIFHKIFNNYILILILLVISMIINNIRSI